MNCSFIGIMFVEKMEKLYKSLLGTELCSTYSLNLLFVFDPAY